ncbi:MAG: pyrimidine reductase family protein [Pseudonocardiaceae bacterium]
MHQLWPAGKLIELDDAAVIKLYRPVSRGPGLRETGMVRINFVSSLDGACTVDGRSTGLSDAADKRVFTILRMLSDVLLVGAGTFRDEGYGDLRLHQDASAWRVAQGLLAHPVLAIVSSRLDLDQNHPAFTNAPRRPLIITQQSSPAEQRHRLASHADVLICGNHFVDLRAAVRMLESRGLRQILCEGGPHLFASLLAADAVDELCLTWSPLLTGPGAERIVAGVGSRVRRMVLAHVLGEGDTIFTRYIRRNVHTQ